MRVQLARRERLRQDKERLAALQQVAATTVKVERVLGSSGAELSTDTAERIATDINQLNFAVWKMKVGALCLDMNTSMTPMTSMTFDSSTHFQKSKLMHIFYTFCVLFDTGLGAVELLGTNKYN